MTAVSSNMWDDFKVFYQSLRQITDIQLFVVNTGLTAGHESELATYQCVIIEPDDDEYRGIGPRWPQWYKPYYLLKVAAEYLIRYILWLDTDIVVLAKLDPIFAAINRRFVVMTDHFAPATCHNDPKLYEHYPLPEGTETGTIAINSGVVGADFERELDKDIIENWCKKTEIIRKNPDLQQYVTLYDQGLLLWVMLEMGIINTAIEELSWNYPAARNVYETNESYRWPTPPTPRMGGSLIDSIRLDNQTAIAAHYAGEPKLQHLCEINHHKTLETKTRKAKGRRTIRLFCIGLERAGTHTVAEAIRRSTDCPNWVRHEAAPDLAFEAFQRSQNKAYHTDDLTEKLAIWQRDDCILVSESNHRLSYFVDIIADRVQASYFILLLRNPLHLIRSRLMNFAVWPDIDHILPGFYQFDRNELRHTFGPGNALQNIYRIRPDNYLERELMDLHLWEIETNLRFALTKLHDVQHMIWWIEDLPEAVRGLPQFLGGHYLNIDKACSIAKQRYGKHCIKLRQQTVQWINNLISTNARRITQTFDSVLKEFGIQHSLNVI